MNPRAAYARRQMRANLRKEGVRITLRRVTRTGGPDQAVNPPRVASVVVNGAHAAGSATLSLRGAAIVGRFLPGDGIAIAGGALAYVGAAVTAQDNEVIVTLTAPLAAPVADGALVSLIWAADRIVAAKVTPYPRNLVDGAMILPTDVRVRVSAMELPVEPSPQDQVLLEVNEGAGQRILTVVGHIPLTEDNVTIAYDIQARAT